MAQGIAAKAGTSVRIFPTHAWAPATLACMGVVFGDIGTSPLYTLSVAAKVASPAGTVAPDAVLGIESLIFWSLIVVSSIKYALLIMRADDQGFRLPSNFEWLICGAFTLERASPWPN